MQCRMTAGLGCKLRLTAELVSLTFWGCGREPVPLKHADPYRERSVVRGLRNSHTPAEVSFWQRVWQNQLLQVCHQRELLVGAVIHQP